MRLIKVTGGLGNQMFIYAFYLRMKKYYPKVRIDLSDMMHYKVHYGYEMHRVFNLPHTEFCINQPLKKVIEFLFFKKIYERKQAPNSLRAFEKKYFWPLLYFKGFYQSERFFEAIDMLKAQKRMRGLLTYTKAHDINYWNINTVRNQPEVSVLKPEWIAYLVLDYGISADWILTGRGGMFKQ